MTVGTEFDIAALEAAIAAKDAAAQAAFFADESELVIMDPRHPPARPAVVRGREAIIAALTDETPGLEHRVTERVSGGERAAYTLVCTYPTGQRVVGNAVLELRDGRIARAHVVQVWDE